MQIIGFAGARQSGKNSACNFLVGQVLKDFGRIDDFRMNPDGNIIANTTYDINGVAEKGDIVVNLNRKDPAFVEYASLNIWPYAKIYAMADRLKETVATLFNIDIALLYGTDEDKQTLTKVKWADMHAFLTKAEVKELKKSDQNEYMTAREVLQYFGTNVCRKLYSDCWVNSCLSQIEQEQSKLALICDLRFQNEIDAVKAAGGKVILLKKDEFGASHASEAELRTVDESVFDGVIDNTNLSMDQKNEELIKLLSSINALNLDPQV